MIRRIAVVSSALLVLAFNNSSFAAQLDFDVLQSDQNIAGGDYSGNAASFGINATTSNSGQPWKLNTSGDINISGNKSGVFVGANGKLTIAGTSSGKSLISQNYTSIGQNYAMDVNGDTEIDNLDIKYLNNNNKEMAVLGTSILAPYNITLKDSNLYVVGNGVSINATTNASLYGINGRDATFDITSINKDLYIDISDNVAESITGLYASEVNIETQDGGNNVFNFSGNTANFMTGLLSSYGEIKNVDFIMNNNVAEVHMGFLNPGELLQGGSSGNLVQIKDNTTKHGIEAVVMYNGDIIGMNFDIQNNHATSNYDWSLMDVSGFWGLQLTNSNVTGTDSANTMIIKNNTSYNNRAYAIWSIGVNNITNMNIFIEGNTFLLSEGKTEFNDTTINILDNSVAFLYGVRLGTAGDVVMNNSHLTSNNGILMDVTEAFVDEGIADDTDAHLYLNNSYAEGKIVTHQGVYHNVLSTLDLSNDSTWVMQGSSNLTTLNNNASTVDMRSSTAGVFNNLTVDDYVGTGGNLIMNTVLGDDTSATDKLIINNSATGTTFLDIRNFGGRGAQTEEGIEVVQSNGVNISSDAFVLKGGKLDTSGFEYLLYQGSGLNADSFYLRSSGSLTDVAKTIAQEPSLVISLARAGMNALNKRMGELRDTSYNDENALWVRTYGKNLKVQDFLDSDMNIFGFETGYDYRLKQFDDRVYVGVVAGLSSANNIKTSQTNGGDHGRGNGDSKSLGVYATWLGNNGWFVDGVFRTFWEDFNMTSYTSTNVPIKYNPNRQMSMASFEVGKQIEWVKEDRSRLFVEPKIELMYGWADAKSFKTSHGQNMKFGETQSLTTKMAIAAGYNKTLDNCVVLEPYVQLAAIEEWKGRTNIKYAEAEYKSDLSGFSIEYLMGLNARLNDYLSFYGDISYEKGSIVESFGGNIGLRYTW